jgi:hypothetical protein
MDNNKQSDEQSGINYTTLQHYLSGTGVTLSTLAVMNTDGNHTANIIFAALAMIIATGSTISSFAGNIISNYFNKRTKIQQLFKKQKSL